MRPLRRVFSISALIAPLVLGGCDGGQGFLPLADAGRPQAPKTQVEARAERPREPTSAPPAGPAGESAARSKVEAARRIDGEARVVTPPGAPSPQDRPATGRDAPAAPIAQPAVGGALPAPPGGVARREPAAQAPAEAVAGVVTESRTADATSPPRPPLEEGPTPVAEPPPEGSALGWIVGLLVAAAVFGGTYVALQPRWRRLRWWLIVRDRFRQVFRRGRERGPVTRASITLLSQAGMPQGADTGEGPRPLDEVGGEPAPRTGDSARYGAPLEPRVADGGVRPGRPAGKSPTEVTLPAIPVPDAPRRDS